MLSEQSKIVNDGGRSKSSVWECSEVETIRSRWSQIGKSIEEWNSWKRWDYRQAEDKIEG